MAKFNIGDKVFILMGKEKFNNIARITCGPACDADQQWVDQLFNHKLKIGTIYDIKEGVATEMYYFDSGNVIVGLYPYEITKKDIISNMWEYFTRLDS